jgi:hypothetical protein
MKRRLICLSLAVLLPLLAARLPACPFCSGPQLTLAEQVQQADAVLLAKWTGGTPAKNQDPGATEYLIAEILRKPKESRVAVGKPLTLVRYRAAKPGDLFLILGTKTGAAIDWGSPLEISKDGFEYLMNLPAPQTPAVERLAYFMGFLEHPDNMISSDAYGEFAKANYEDICKLAPNMPREKLREWLVSPDTSPSRLGLYGLMLGLCGTPDDVELMQEKITRVEGDFRLGIDGVMGGFLLLTGEKGLDVLDETKLKDKKSPFSETYAAMGAIRFMWQYGRDKIAPDRLRASMRLLLDRPELADLVIADLARMEDWSAQDRLMELYGADDYNIPSIKRSIVRYMLVSTKVPERPASALFPANVASTDEALPAHVEKGRLYLAQLEERDPKTVKDAKRFWVVK